MSLTKIAGFILIVLGVAVGMDAFLIDALAQGGVWTSDTAQLEDTTRAVCGAYDTLAGGPVATIIATIAIIGLGIGAINGYVTTTQMLIVAICIAAVIGSFSIASLITGRDTPCDEQIQIYANNSTTSGGTTPGGGPSGAGQPADCEIIPIPISVSFISGGSQGAAITIPVDESYTLYFNASNSSGGKGGFASATACAGPNNPPINCSAQSINFSGYASYDMGSLSAGAAFASIQVLGGLTVQDMDLRSSTCNAPAISGGGCTPVSLPIGSYTLSPQTSASGLPTDVNITQDGDYVVELFTTFSSIPPPGWIAEVQVCLQSAFSGQTCATQSVTNSGTTMFNFGGLLAANSPYSINMFNMQPIANPNSVTISADAALTACL